MSKHKLKLVIEPNTTLVQDENICLGSDKSGALWLETAWKITPWLDNDEDPEQLLYVLQQDTRWPDRQNASDKELYVGPEIRVVQLRSQKVTAYVVAIRPEGTPNAKS